jgi:hypothetical protein
MPKIFLNHFTGTWVPLDSSSHPIINRFQIERRNNIFLMCAQDFMTPEQPFFYVCKANGRHLSFTPEQYNANEYEDDFVLKQSSDLWYDRQLGCLYFLNAVYVRSDDKIFRIDSGRIKLIPAPPDTAKISIKPEAPDFDIH